MLALFFDGGGGLGDGVGDYVEGILRELVRECRFQRVSARQAYHVDEGDGVMGLLGGVSGWDWKV